MPISGSGKSRLNLLLLAAILYGIIVLGIGSYYCWPNIEALSLAGEAKAIGVFNSAESLLKNYDGRFFTNILHGINPLVIGNIYGYKIMPFLAFFLFTYSFYFLIETIYELEKNKTEAVILAFFFAIIHFALSPELVNELFNMIGSFVYLYGFCFWMLWVGGVLRFSYATKPLWKHFYFFFICIFLICSTGTSEQILVLNFISIFSFLIYYILRSKEGFIRFIPVFLIGISSILFFISCPGIRVRINDFSSETDYNHTLLDSIQLGISHYIIFIKQLFTDSYALFLPCILFVSTKFQLRSNFKEFIQSIKPKLLYLLPSILIIPFFLTLPYYLPAGNMEIIPYRIYNTVISTTQVFLLITLSFITCFFTLKIHYRSLQYFLLVWLLFSLFMGHNNYKKIIKEYSSGKYDVLNDVMLKNFNELHKAQQSKTHWKSAFIEPFYDKQLTIYYPVILKENREDSHWNFAIERYFMLNEVGLKNDTINKKVLLNKMLNE